jgi:hypothetical protein
VKCVKRPKVIIVRNYTALKREMAEVKEIKANLAFAEHSYGAQNSCVCRFSRCLKCLSPHPLYW